MKINSDKKYVVNGIDIAYSGLDRAMVIMNGFEESLQPHKARAIQYAKSMSDNYVDVFKGKITLYEVIEYSKEDTECEHGKEIYNAHDALIDVQRLFNEIKDLDDMIGTVQNPIRLADYDTYELEAITLKMIASIHELEVEAGELYTEWLDPIDFDVSEVVDRALTVLRENEEEFDLLKVVKTLLELANYFELEETITYTGKLLLD